MGKTVDLVLSGGGVLGVGHVGAASVLLEHGYSFSRIAGTSAGSIVGALLAAGMPIDQLKPLVESIDYASFLDRDTIDRIPCWVRPTR